jgi:hypothetical protein
MEALVMANIPDMKLVVVDGEVLERMEKRLDAIAELMAALLDSVQAEEQEEPLVDLDGEVTQRIKHEQEWL